MRRKWLKVLLAVVLLLVLSAGTALAAGGPLRIQRYWGGSFLWSLDLTGSEAQGIYEAMDDAAIGTGAAAAVIKVLETTLGKLLPYVAAITAAAKLGSWALQRCSAKGRNDIAVHGWGTLAVDWVATEERDRIAFKAGDYDRHGYIYQDIFVPLWCNGN